ncbi:MAG: glycosyltransferase [Muribaculaceae bacterium]|nr:glycosyltransferase [Muribaculaceae bacterium]
MSRPLVSVVVPAYNVGTAFLRDAISSALGQTYGNLEVIVVNDASTDNTMECVGEFADPRLRVIDLPENRGLSGARNAGTEAASGSWVTFLDADDRMMPEMTERLLDMADTTGADIACCGFMRTRPRAILPESSGVRPVLTVSPEAAIADALYQTGSLNNSACGKLYRRELCLRQQWIEGWFEDLRTFYRIFLLAGRIAWTAEPLYAYTVNPASYMQRFTPGRAVVLDVTEEMVGYMEAHCPELVAAASDRALSAAFNILKLMRANDVKNPEVAARCKSIIRRYRCRSLFNRRVRAKNKLAILASYLGGLHLL